MDKKKIMLVNLKNVILRFILHLIHHESFSFISNNKFT
jgi:hypothetical protein